MIMEINSATIDRIQDYLQRQVDDLNDREAQALLDDLEDWQIEQIQACVDKLVQSPNSSKLAQKAAEPPSFRIDAYYAEPLKRAS